MPPTALVLTVGTGNENDIPGTILSPFRKSLGAGSWDHILLLPSQSTAHLAALVRGDHPLLAARMRIEPLPGPEDEFDLDRAFDHFEAALLKLLDSGCVPASITVDLTRGTKAMSAALALAAVAAGIHSIRYIEGSAKDHSGMTISGTERVSDVSAITVSRSRTLSLAESFLRQGQFAAARATLASDPAISHHPRYGATARWLAWAAGFWGDWDAFDHPSAEMALGQLQNEATVPPVLRDLTPSPPHRAVLSTLSRDVPADPADRVPLCRAIGADLLANARRRLALGQTEEALVRIYRVLELSGQTRLFTYGLDSERVPRDHPKVAAWYDYKLNKGNAPELSKKDTMKLARENVATLLRHLQDPLAEQLLKLGWLPGFDPTLRNLSVLAHGLVARSRGLSTQIQDWLARIETFYCSEDPGNQALLLAARFPFFPAP